MFGGLLDPGYSQRTDAISALASTESHSAILGLMAFAGLALTAISTGVAVLSTLRGRAAAVCGVLVILAGLATAADGVLRQSCSSLRPDCLARESGGAVSNAHMLHNLIALPLFAFLVVAGFMLVAAVRRTPAVRSLWGAVMSAAPCLGVVPRLVRLRRLRRQRRVGAARVGAPRVRIAARRCCESFKSRRRRTGIDVRIGPEDLTARPVQLRRRGAPSCPHQADFNRRQP